MKNFIATHNFRSEELRKEYFEMMEKLSSEEINNSVKGEHAHCQMNWANGLKSMKMFCWWKATDSDAIIAQLGDLNNFFSTESYEMDEIIDTRG